MYDVIPASEVQPGDTILSNMGWKILVNHVEPYHYDLYEIQGVSDGDQVWVIDDFVKLVA